MTAKGRHAANNRRAVGRPKALPTAQNARYSTPEGGVGDGLAPAVARPLGSQMRRCEPEPDFAPLGPKGQRLTANRHLVPNSLLGAHGAIPAHAGGKRCQFPTS